MLQSNPVHANAVAGLATSATAQATVEVRQLSALMQQKAGLKPHLQPALSAYPVCIPVHTSSQPVFLPLPQSRAGCQPHLLLRVEYHTLSKSANPEVLSSSPAALPAVAAAPRDRRALWRDGAAGIRPRLLTARQP